MKQTPKEELTLAAKEAVKVIADASAAAAKVIAEAASEALKVTNVKNSYDHDLLVELKSKLEDLKVDIADLKSGTSSQIGDHESRLRLLETKIWVMVGGLTILSFATPYVFSLLK